MSGKEVINISFGAQAAYVQTHFWNIAQRVPDAYRAQFYEGQKQLMPRSVNIIPFGDVGPLPWGTEIDVELPESEKINTKEPLSDYHEKFYDKSSETFKLEYSKQAEILFNAWQTDTRCEGITDARIQLNNIRHASDFMEYDRELTEYSDFGRENERILDAIRKQLERCDSVSGFVLETSNNQGSNEQILDYLNDNTPKQSILLFDVHTDSKYAAFEKSQFQYQLNQYSSHALYSEHLVTEQLYNDTASLSAKLSELQCVLNAQKYSLDSIESGLMLSPYLNLIDYQGTLQKGLLQSELRQLKNSFAHVLISEEQVQNGTERFLSLREETIELSETFPHLFDGAIKYRTELQQEEALYNGSKNIKLLEKQYALCDKFTRYEKVQELCEETTMEAGEFIREEYEAYSDGL